MGQNGEEWILTSLASLLGRRVTQSIARWKIFLYHIEFFLSEEGNPAGLSSCSGGLRPLVELCVEPAGLCGRSTGVAVPLRVVPSPTGLPSKRGPGMEAGQSHKGAQGWDLGEASTSKSSPPKEGIAAGAELYTKEQNTNTFRVLHTLPTLGNGCRGWPPSPKGPSRPAAITTLPSILHSPLTNLSLHYVFSPNFRPFPSACCC